MDAQNKVEWEKLFLEAENPFTNAIIRNAWQSNIIKTDVASINENLTNLVLKLLIDVKANKYSTACLCQGQPGVGKSHFLGRLRNLSVTQSFLFVSVKPISDVTNIYNHIYKEIFYSLRKKSDSDRLAPIDQLISSILTNTLIKTLEERNKVNPLSKRLKNLLNQMKNDSTLILKILDQDKSTLEIFNSVSNKAIDLVEMDFPEINTNFLTVLFKYLNPEIRSIALRWLQGDDISEEHLAILGVKETIDNEQLHKVFYIAL